MQNSKNEEDGIKSSKSWGSERERFQKSNIHVSHVLNITLPLSTGKVCLISLSPSHSKVFNLFWKGDFSSPYFYDLHFWASSFKLKKGKKILRNAKDPFKTAKAWVLTITFKHIYYITGNGYYRMLGAEIGHVLFSI